MRSNGILCHDRPSGPGLDDAVPGRRLSVLAVTSEVPWPLNTGGHLRTFHLLRALAGRFRVRLVTGGETTRGSINALEDEAIAVTPVELSPRTHWREFLRVLAAASRREPYVFYRRHDRRPIWRALRAEIDREPPDLLYLDHLDSFLYRTIKPEVPAVIDLHNIYSRLARRVGEEQSSTPSRIYLRREARLLSRVEQRVARSSDTLLTVSEEERSHFAAIGARSVHVVPNGVDCAAYAALPVGRGGSTPIILYVGALSWGPNVAAARSLAADILPTVRACIPGARVRIVGRDPAPSVRALADLPGVEVIGSAPEILTHLREATLLAVPLAAGGGTRLKILEAFAAGLPVVSTPVGCEGLDVAHMEHLLIADRGRLAEEIVTLLRTEALGRRLASAARNLVMNRYDWGTVGRIACSIVEKAGA